MRVCRKCDTPKPATQFYARRRVCINCLRIYNQLKYTERKHDPTYQAQVLAAKQRLWAKRGTTYDAQAYHNRKIKKMIQEGTML